MKISRQYINGRLACMVTYLPAPALIRLFSNYSHLNGTEMSLPEPL